MIRITYTKQYQLLLILHAHFCLLWLVRGTVIVFEKNISQRGTKTFHVSHNVEYFFFNRVKFERGTQNLFFVFLINQQ